jgi:formylglycine-generating enzyme required for sulfatase activity
MKTNAKSLIAFAALAVICQPAVSDAASPEVSNIRATQRAGTKLVDIYYDVTDPENDPLTVAIQVYDGTTALPTYTVTGDVGSGVTVGANKHIIWNAGQDWNRRFTGTGKARILVDDLSITSPSATMAFVPGGFGKPTGSSYEIYTSGFYMDKLEVSKTLWDSVYQWALTNGYQFDNAGYAAATAHPVTGISWFDAIKWCNARSQKDGLTPCYYTDAARTQVYKAGQATLDNNWVSWEANGYRLPTVAEWIKAYRGGQAGGYYPWSSYYGNQEDNISPSLANYYQRSTSKQMLPVGYFNGNQTPIGPDNKNGFGLYDMGGNASEWCWDREFTNWFSGYAEARDDNSKGPNLGQGASRAWAGSFYVGSTNFSDQFYELATTGRKPTDGGGGYSYIIFSSIGMRCLRAK